ncbi:MAG: hypothetical protein RJA61_563 [Candidatus Parcubacteria bacterium]|jgi:undecaprenyl-diphosphatase
MQEFFQSLLLGIVQGLSEFIPVSSSGHLIIVRELFGIDISQTLVFDIFLHVGTLSAVVVYFWSDIKSLIISTYRVVLRRAVRPEREFVGMIALATLPAVVLGLFLGSMFEKVFRSSTLVALSLVLGSLLMWFAEWFYEKYSLKDGVLSLKKSFQVGLFQSLALIPGISRSGATISGGMIIGFSRESAVRFSFLLSVPVIFGAFVKSILTYEAGSISVSLLSVIAGSIASFAVGLLAIHFLVTFLKYRTLKVFIWYRVLLAICIVIFL